MSAPLLPSTSPCPKCGMTVPGLQITACFCGWRSDIWPTPTRPALRLVPPPEDDR